MTLDESLRLLRDKFPVPDFSSFDLKTPVETLRRQFFLASRSIEPDVPEMADVSPRMVDGAAGKLKARLYTPLGAGIGPGPGIIFYHGGGFVLGDLDSHDMICRRLAEGSRCRVLSVDYRLAPEHAFPAAHLDALASWAWVMDHAAELDMDPARLAVAGDSAGGNLSAYLAQETNRAGKHRPAFQLLIYPLMQFADIRAKKMPFQQSGFFISANLFEYFRDAYVSEEAHRMDPRMSPLFADAASLKGLPPAHVIVCGWDPLHDEGLAYVHKMASSGVPVTVREHPGMVHGFMNMTAVSEPVRTAIRDAGKVVGHALGAL